MDQGQRLSHDWFDEPLPENVVAGEGSWIASAFSFLHFRSLRPIGVRTGAHSGVYMESFFELGDAGEVEIGDYCSLVGAIISTNAKVTIGDYVFIAHEVVIADDAFARPLGRGPAPEARGPTIGSDVWVGMGASVVGDVTIGDGAIVAARAVVRSDVPPLSVVAGNPAVVVRKLDEGPQRMKPTAG